MNKIKICGLKSENDIKIVNKYEPEYIGFILAPSKRQISYEVARALRGLLKPEIKAVGVFVNEQMEVIEAYAKTKIIDVIQLHGDETIEFITTLKKRLNLPMIKAIRVRDEVQLHQLMPYINQVPADYVLFDTYHEGMYGGSGKSFDWEVLKRVERPYFLAGGIGLHNIASACQLHPFGIDVSSGVETEGSKDADKVRALIQAVRFCKEQ